MKSRSMLIGIAMAAVLNGTAVNAQVLGGGLGGGLSGGLRDMSMTTQGALNGSLGADIDTRTLHRTTRNTAERVTNRARNATSTVRDRATATVDQTREQASEAHHVATATSSAAASVVGAVNDAQIDGAADMAGSATSNVGRDSINLAGTAEGAGNGAVTGGALPQPDLTNVAPARLAGGEATNVSTVTQQAGEPAKDSAEPAASRPAPRSKSLDIAGDANGSAAASRSGVAAEGNGSASASRK